MDKLSIENLHQYKDQVLSKLGEAVSSNEYTKNLTEYISKVDQQTYNIIGISTITLFSMFYLLDKLLGKNTTEAPKNKKKRKKKKTKTPLQIANAQIDEILNDTKKNLVPEFKAFKEDFELGNYKGSNFKKNTKEDPNFQVLYFNEILLKKLMELDEVDTLGNDDLRSKRKNAIKYIQDYHKELDDIKKRI